MKCPNCGRENYSNANYCRFCGNELHQETSVLKKENIKQIGLKDLFSNVFKRHNNTEFEEVFAGGTHYNKLPLYEVSNKAPTPWVYSRVLMFFIIIYFLFIICVDVFNNSYALTAFMFLGSLAIPFSLLIFYFECNTPKNLSIITTVRVFAMGGTFSLIVTLFLYSIFPTINELNTINAMLIGLIEETGKFAITYFLIKRIKPRYIINGVLLGAAVGAGFSVFESSGYALGNIFEESGISVAGLIALRGVLSIGGHTTWAGIEGGAIIYARGEDNLHFSVCLRSKFLKYFLVCILLHGIWDSPLFNDIFIIKYSVLCIIPFILSLRMIKLGQKQIYELQLKEIEQFYLNPYFEDDDDNDDIFLG